MKTGLYFGSFNPIHIGHTAIANYIVEYTDLQELWFVVSPQNPLKKRKTLLDDYQRLELVHRAIGKFDKFRVCDIEFKMPKPSYTIDTLTYLADKYPKRTFSIIMGSDNVFTLKKWKNYEQIVKNHAIYVYPRPGYIGNEPIPPEEFNYIDAPQIEISSSFIRESIKNNKDVRFFMSENVFKYIDEMNFYR